jgi:maltose-binding protein MalE
MIPRIKPYRLRLIPLKKIIYTSSIVLIVAATTLLAGCSREPSESNIKDAYTHEVDQTNNLTKKFGGDQMAIKVNGLKKVDCKESSDKGQFNCKVDINLTIPLIGQHDQQTTLTLTKGDLGDGKQGWLIVRGANASN